MFLLLVSHSSLQSRALSARSGSPVPSVPRRGGDTHSPTGAAAGWRGAGAPARAPRVRPPSGTRGEISAEDPVLLTRQVPGSVKKPEGTCRRERVQPNLTNPSCADVLPRPSRTLVFYPKEQCAKGAGGSVPRRGTRRSQTTADEVSA